VRIYDDIDGSLQLKFALDPSDVSQAVGTPGQSGSRTLSSGFEVVDVVDLNGDGPNEVVGAYTGGVTAQFAAPIVIGWNPARDEYQSAALLRQSAFDPPLPPRPVERAQQANYDVPFTVRGSGSPIRAWAARAFVIAANPFDQGRSSVLIAAVPAPTFGALQIGYWPVGARPLFNEKPLTPWCIGGARGSTRFISRRPTRADPESLLASTFHKSVRRNRLRRNRGSLTGVLGVVVNGDCIVAE
jgi:hypothetical protein